MVSTMHYNLLLDFQIYVASYELSYRNVTSRNRSKVTMNLISCQILIMKAIFNTLKTKETLGLISIKFACPDWQLVNICNADYCTLHPFPMYMVLYVKLQELTIRILVLQISTSCYLESKMIKENFAFLILGILELYTR